MTASHRAIELGFLKSHTRGGAPGFTDVLSNLGKRLAIEEHGLVIKQYPSCGYTHRAVDGMIELRARGITAKDIVAIKVRMPEHFGAALRYGVPKDEREALFSMPYCLATAAINGSLGFRHFTPDAIRDEQVVRLASRVEVETYPVSNLNVNMGPEAPDTISVRLRDGRTRELVVDFPVGAPARPASRTEIERKFSECIRSAEVVGRADELLSLLWNLEELASTRELTSRLAASVHPRTRMVAAS